MRPVPCLYPAHIIGQENRHIRRTCKIHFLIHFKQRIYKPSFLESFHFLKNRHTPCHSSTNKQTNKQTNIFPNPPTSFSQAPKIPILHSSPPLLHLFLQPHEQYSTTLTIPPFFPPLHTSNLPSLYPGALGGFCAATHLSAGAPLSLTPVGSVG